MSRKFFALKPAYIIVSGDPSTNVNTVIKVVNDTFNAMRAHGRNPVIFGVEGNICSDIARAIAEAQNVPVRMGSVSELIHDISSRNLRKDHVQMVLFQTPEYAGSQEALDLLYGCRQFNGTLRMYSVFHDIWLNCRWNVDWVVDFNNRFLRTLGSWSMDDNAKRSLFRERMLYLQKYPASKLYKQDKRERVYA